MATTEAPATRDSVSADSSYDGFISYSHAADDLLAPRLQAGLQRFAKPWWKRRALRIFRDESSLTANPHLWASIVEAMDDSGWFVLLLSPDAADSEWVNREVEYWVENKDPDRIIPVLTDGDFAYANGHVVSDAAPPALRGAFSDEPRWVDLRFARTEEQLDLNNASFRAAIADIASPIRGVPKDELESEEVRQHRRTIRTAWAGVLAVLLLAVLAGGAAIYAVGQSNEASAQRDIAEQREAEATEFAKQVVDFAERLQSEAAPPGSDFVRADRRNIPLPVHESPPATPRLAFLELFCSNIAENCFPSGFFLHPSEPLIAQAWLAYEPFHIRHGFVNPAEEPLGMSFPPEFEVQVFVTRRSGPALADGVFEIDQSYRFTPDYLVRTSSERCGPAFFEQTEPLPCDEFVHEFADGLPPGVYDFWVAWQAPCSSWTTAAVCGENDPPVTLFAAALPDQPLYHEDYQPADHAAEFFPDPEFFDDAWPFDPWQKPDELTDQ